MEGCHAGDMCCGGHRPSSLSAAPKGGGAGMVMHHIGDAGARRVKRHVAHGWPGLESIRKKMNGTAHYVPIVMN